MDSKKHNISNTGPLSWQTIKAYLGGELSDKEMYNLELKTQNEPFEQEAFDGFYNHAPASMEYDLYDLRKKIERKTGYTLRSEQVIRVRMNWKLIAGIAFLVLLIPFVFILVTRSSKSNSVHDQNISTEETTSLAPASKDSFSNKILASDTIQTEEEVSVDSPSLSRQKSVHVVRKQTEINPKAEVMADLEKHTLDNNRILALTGQRVNPQSSPKPEIVEPFRSFEGDSQHPVSNAPMGTNTSTIRNTTRDVLSRIPARPPGGMEGYKAYLKSQLLNYSSVVKGTFIITLKIKKDGEVRDVVIRDGGRRKTNKKLQSIVEKAPVWVPASEKGKKIEDIATFELILD